MTTVARYEVRADDQTTAAARQAQRNMTGIERGIHRANRAAMGFRSTLGALGVTLGLGAAVEGLRRLVTSSIEAQDAAAKMGAAYQLSAEQIERLALAAEHGGSNMGEFQSATGALTGKLREALNPLSAAAKAFRELGVDPAQLRLLDVEERFRAVGNAIRALPTERQFDFASYIFGESGPRALRILEGLPAARKTIEEVGSALKDGGKAAEESTDAWTRLKQAAKALGAEIADVATPAVDGLTEHVTTGFVELRKVIGDVRAEMAAEGLDAAEVLRLVTPPGPLRSLSAPPGSRLSEEPAPPPAAPARVPVDALAPVVEQLEQLNRTSDEILRRTGPG